MGAGTPADQTRSRKGRSDSGILVGDVITHVEKKPVRLAVDVDQVLEEEKPGDRVALTVRRSQGGGPAVLDLRRRAGRTSSGIGWSGAAIEGGTAAEPSIPADLADPSRGQGCASGAGRVRPTTVAAQQQLGRQIDRREISGRRVRLRLDPAAMQRLGVTGDLEIVKRYRLAPAEQIKTSTGPIRCITCESNWNCRTVGLSHST